MLDVARIPKSPPALPLLVLRELRVCSGILSARGCPACYRPPVADDPIKRARGHEHAGEIDQALAAYREVEPASPSYAESRIRIVGITLLRGQVEAAEREARAFVALRPSQPESHGSLGQVLRFQGKHEIAIESFIKAVALTPANAGYHALLCDARRAKYWSPDADLYQGLRIAAAQDKAQPSAHYRLLQLEYVGLMINPDVLRWLTGDEDRMPKRLMETLDGRFEGRFTHALADAAKWRAGARRAGSEFAPQEARVTFAEGKPVDGEIEDSDTTIGGALEAIEKDEYRIVPFREIRSIEFGAAASWVKSKLTLKSGRATEVEVPALYLLTEGCRAAQLREGRGTAWRHLSDDLHVGLGLRSFCLRKQRSESTVGLNRIKRIEFA